MHPLIQGRVLTDLTAGKTLLEAAAAAGLNRTTVHRARKTDAAFDGAVRKALATGQRERKRLATIAARARQRQTRVVVSLDQAPQSQDVLRGIALHFGRYEHWSTYQVARHDLRYALWLLGRLPQGTLLRASLRDAVAAELVAEQLEDLA